MRQEVTRVLNVFSKIAQDNAFPGLGDLFRALSEERARRFVDWLNEADPTRQHSAEVAIGGLVTHPQGEVIVRHICREVMFGTETISLAALALIASEASRNADESYYGRAARAVDGLANEEALTFLILLKNPSDLHIHREWRSMCAFDLKCASEQHWKSYTTVLGLDEEQIHGGLAACIQRRLLLPDGGPYGLSGDDDYAPTRFALSVNTPKYFRLLVDALRLSEPVAHKVLSPFSFSSVEAMCAAPQTRRDEAAGCDDAT